MKQKMKAMVFTEYGPPEVLRMAELDRPDPQENEILVRVRASTVAYGDLTARQFARIPPRDFNMPFLFWLPALFMFGIRKPNHQILGSELSGEVEAVGAKVTVFKPGDAVMAYTGAKMGAYAQYRCLPEDSLVVHKPANLSHVEAATLPYGGTMAMSLFTHLEISSGQKVLINGASGGIGAMALRLAKHAGAEVTGVCGGPRMDKVKALGADHVMDYRKGDFTRGNLSYDLVVDVLGKSNYGRVKGVLREGGAYFLTSFKLRHLLSIVGATFNRKHTVQCVFLDEKKAYLESIRALVEIGALPVVLDRTFTLDQTVAAHRYVESGQHTGPVVITIP